MTVLLPLCPNPQFLVLLRLLKFSSGNLIARKPHSVRALIAVGDPSSAPEPLDPLGALERENGMKLWFEALGFMMFHV